MKNTPFTHLLFTPAVIMLMLSCGQGTHTENNAAPGQPPKTGPDQTTVAEVKKEFKTSSGKTIVVAETHPQGQSMSNIAVSFSGDATSQMIFTDVDPVNKVLVADLDGNGFDELYIITTSAGSGSYGNVIGIASNADKSLSQVFFPPLIEKDMAKGGLFDGYSGHDEFEITGNALSRTFPVKPPGSAKRTIIYTLTSGKAGYRLIVKTATGCRAYPGLRERYLSTLNSAHTGQWSEIVFEE